MKKEILNTINKIKNKEEVTHEEYEKIQSYLNGTGLEFDFTHRELCEVCKRNENLVYEHINP